MDAGEEVRERVLEGEGDREAADAEGRQDRRDGDAEVVEKDQQADRPHDGPYGGPGQSGHADGQGPALAEAYDQRGQ